MSTEPINFDHINDILFSQYTKTFKNRHRLTLNRIAHLRKNGIYASELAGFLNLIMLCQRYIKNGNENFINVCGNLVVCSMLPFLQSKSFEQIEYFDTICNNLKQSANLCSLGYGSLIISVSRGLMSFLNVCQYYNLDISQQSNNSIPKHFNQNINFRAVAESGIISELVSALKQWIDGRRYKDESAQKRSDIGVYIIQACRDLSYSQPCVKTLIHEGILTVPNYFHARSNGHNFVTTSIELLWNCLEWCYDECMPHITTALFEVLTDDLSFYLGNGARMDEKHTRNCVLSIFVLLSKNESKHCYFERCKIMDIIIQFLTCSEHNITPTPEDYEMVSLMLCIVNRTIRSHRILSKLIEYNFATKLTNAYFQINASQNNADPKSPPNQRRSGNGAFSPTSRAPNIDTSALDAFTSPTRNQQRSVTNSVTLWSPVQLESLQITTLSLFCDIVTIIPQHFIRQNILGRLFNYWQTNMQLQRWKLDKITKKLTQFLSISLNHCVKISVNSNEKSVITAQHISQTLEPFANASLCDTLLHVICEFSSNQSTKISAVTILYCVAKLMPEWRREFNEAIVKTLISVLDEFPILPYYEHFQTSLIECLRIMLRLENNGQILNAFNGVEMLCNIIEDGTLNLKSNAIDCILEMVCVQYTHTIIDSLKTVETKNKRNFTQLLVYIWNQSKNNQNANDIQTIQTTIHCLFKALENTDVITAADSETLFYLSEITQFGSRQTLDEWMTLYSQFINENSLVSSDRQLLERKIREFQSFQIETIESENEFKSTQNEEIQQKLESLVKVSNTTKTEAPKVSRRATLMKASVKLSKQEKERMIAASLQTAETAKRILGPLKSAVKK